MLRIGSIVWGVKNLPAGIDFWRDALDYKLLREASAEEAILIPRNGVGPQLILKKVTSSTARRHHMDLHTLEQPAEVARLQGLGATEVDWVYEADADYVVLADPDGNRFCVVQHQVG